jgi:hypothetical protein
LTVVGAAGRVGTIAHNIAAACSAQTAYFKMTVEIELATIHAGNAAYALA